MSRTNSFVLFGLGIFASVFFVAFVITLPQSGYLDQYDDSTHVAQRTGINLISGSGVNITSADSPANQRVDYTITANLSPGNIPLTDTYILIGSGSDVAAEQAISGDVLITNTGVTTIQPASVDLGTDTDRLLDDDTALLIGTDSDGTALFDSGNSEITLQSTDESATLRDRLAIETNENTAVFQYYGSKPNYDTPDATCTNYECAGIVHYFTWDANHTVIHAAPTGATINPNIYRQYFFGDDNAGNIDEYAQVRVWMDDPTSGTEDGGIEWWVTVDGTRAALLELAGSSFIQLNGSKTGLEVRYKGSAGGPNGTVLEFEPDGDVMFTQKASQVDLSPLAMVHIEKSDVSGAAADAETVLFIEKGANTTIQCETVDSVQCGVRFSSPTASDDGWIRYHHVNEGGADPPSTFSMGTASVERLRYSAGAFAFQEATSITTSAGNLTLNPTTATDASGDPLLIQNVSQNDSPGTTTNGQIRLWEDADGGPVGRILAHINGSTYQFNADAGLSFNNRPYQYQQDKERFALAREQWKADTLTALYTPYQTIRAAYPGLNRPSLTPTWSDSFLNALRSEYIVLKAVQDYFSADYPLIHDLPVVPTLAVLESQQPHPDPATYKVPDADLNETLSAISGTQIREGDAVILRVDREVTDDGTVTQIHMVPSLLIEEIKAAKDKLERFLDIDNGPVGDAPTCGAANRGHQYLVHGAPGVADTLWVCMKSASDAYGWERVK